MTPRTLALVFGLSLALLAPAQAQVAEDLVVHEWGTFTTIASPDGSTRQWRPLVG